MSGSAATITGGDKQWQYCAAMLLSKEAEVLQRIRQLEAIVGMTEKRASVGYVQGSFFLS